MIAKLVDAHAHKRRKNNIHLGGEQGRRFNEFTEKTRKRPFFF